MVEGEGYLRAVTAAGPHSLWPQFPLERTKLAREGQAPRLTCLCPPQPPAAPGLGQPGGGGFRKYRFILFKRPWHRQGPQSPERGGERPQVTQHGGLGWAGPWALRTGTLEADRPLSAGQ